MRKVALSVLGLAAGTMMMSGAAMAELNSDYEVRNNAGKHQYYVWCTGMDDYETQVDAANFKEGQGKAYEEAKAKAGGNNCWPIWQGLVQ